MQRYGALLEQIDIRRAELQTRMLRFSEEEQAAENRVTLANGNLEGIRKHIEALRAESAVKEGQVAKLQEELHDANALLDDVQTRYHRDNSRLDSLRTLNEHYEGYGNAIRRVMEQLGGSSVRSLLLPKARSADSLGTVTETVSACRSMSRQKIGALIVFERQNSLEEYFRTGTVVNADVSEELLKNIFFPKAALHDGAVIIRRDRIAAAGCVLPLTENANLSRDLGTRHRAAIGMSEHSDAVVVVVSEETGVISCVIGGVLRRYLTPETLERVLREELLEDSAPPVRHRLGELFGKMRNRKEEDDHAEK